MRFARPLLLVVIGLACSDKATGVEDESLVQLIHYYPFDTDARDVAGHVDGLLFGAATVANGVLSLDGLSGFVEFPGELIPVSGNYSVAFFAKQRETQDHVVEIISQGFSTGPGFYIGYDGFGQIRATDVSLPNTGVNAPAVDGKRHHFALTVDSTLGRSVLFVDGVARKSYNLAFATPSGGSDTRLGRQYEPYLEFFSGDIDDVRIYRRALTGSEIAALILKSR